MSDHYKPTDADALRMENELLAFEIQFLKSKLAEQSRRQAAGGVSGAEERRAVDDLRWVLRRLEGTPLRYALRRRPGYQTLVDRWL